MVHKPGKSWLFCLLGLIIIGLYSCNDTHIQQLRFKKLLVEYAEKPLNIEEHHPRFSWVVSSQGNNRSQTAYRILVASSPAFLDQNEGDIWDTGWQVSSVTIQHTYAGQNLKSSTSYYWKVMIRDEHGIAHHSPISWFSTALLRPADWQAQWIGKGPANEPLPAKGFYGSLKDQQEMTDTIAHEGRSLLLRKHVNLTGKIKSARAYVSGLGFYEFYINGSRIGNHVLTPAKTPFHRHILYDTYDVSCHLKKGNNVLGFHLGNGWYNPYKKWWNQYRMQWFGAKKAIAQVIVTFDDGSQQTILSDSTWKWADGPVLFSCVYDGETYDAREEKSRWNLPGYDASEWKPVTVFNTVKSKLVSQQMPAIQVIDNIHPTLIKTGEGGLKVYDMRQNFTGWVQIALSGEKGTKVTLRFAEDIKPDSSLDVTSNEHARATAQYILKGNGTEVYEPSFTYFGFRYAEVSSDKPVSIRKITGRVVHSANTSTGNFDSGNTLVNKIHRATVWSQKSNMLGYPMDCPQRDERLGWLGDAQVSAEQAMFNFDMALFYRNWFAGIRDNQDIITGDIPIISPQPYMPDEGIEWSSTYLIMLWQYYIHYGDTRILKEHYPAMHRYMQFLDSLAVKHILPQGWIGDWGSMVKDWKEGQPESVPTAFYIFNARIMAKTASILGMYHDAETYRQLEKDIINAYNKKYLNAATGNYLQGSQMDNAFPLFLDIVPDSLRSKVLDNLVNDIMANNQGHLTTGVLGTKYMPEALAKWGRHDVAWHLINQKTYPGWNQMMEKYTTVCEFWTLKQSKNHVMMGSIDAWFYKYLAGIQVDENHPAWSHFIIRPFIPEQLDHAQATVETIRGTIHSQWNKTTDGVIIHLSIPFNTSASLSLPGSPQSTITKDHAPLKSCDAFKYLGYSGGYHRLEVNSGDYSFKISK